MGTQFGWFYDVIAGAILLICIFLCGRKGVMKGVFLAVSCIASAFVAFAIGGAVSDSICKNTILESNTKKIENSIESDTFLNNYSAYLENMGYSVRIDKSKLENIFLTSEQIDKDVVKYLNNINARPVEKDEAVLLEKIHEGYAVVIRDIVSQSLSKFAAETAFETIKNDPSGMQELIPMFRNFEDLTPPCEFIAKNYTSEAYRTTFLLGTFVVLFAVFTLFFICCVNALTAGRESGSVSAGSHFAGGIFGIIAGAAVILVVAAGVRLSAVMGSNEMLFFNNSVIEKSYVFKYFYHIIEKF